MTSPIKLYKLRDQEDGFTTEEAMFKTIPSFCSDVLVADDVFVILKHSRCSKGRYLYVLCVNRDKVGWIYVTTIWDRLEQV